MSVLRTAALSVSFGGVRALKGVDLEVPGGQFIGLIGPNGAGKTTLIDAITGFVRSTGSVELDGKDIARLAPHERAQKGVVRTWQSTELFDDLNLAENLMVARERPTIWRTAKQLLGASRQMDDHVEATLRLVGLEGLAGSTPRELSQGQRKLAGVARALMAEPSVLCLDEPAAGLDTTESAQLGERLRQVVDQATAVLLVDHDMSLVFAICDQVVVMEFGEVIARGTPEEVRRDPRVIQAYLGSSGEGIDPATVVRAPKASE